MPEELRLMIGTPTITGAKIGKWGEVRIQADEGPGGNSGLGPEALDLHGISVHYCLENELGLPPRVREKLLVAVIEGAHPQWLEDGPNSPPEITFETDSANHNRCAMLLTEQPVGDGTRAKLTTWERDAASTPGRHDTDIILSKGQVANLIMTLMALYPRLHEAEDA